MYPIVIIFVILMYTHVFMISYVAKNKLNWIELNSLNHRYGKLPKDDATFVERVCQSCFSSAIRGALVVSCLWDHLLRYELEKKGLQYMDTALCELGIPGLQNFNAELFVMFASRVSSLSFFLLLFDYLTQFHFLGEEICLKKV